MVCGTDKKLGLRMTNNAVDIGVRVESPAEIYEPITDICYESKLVYYSRSFDDRIRTFCMNPNGFVVTENNDGLLTVNGHSFAHKKSENTNFAILVSKSFTEPFNEPLPMVSTLLRWPICSVAGRLFSVLATCGMVTDPPGNVLCVVW